MRYQKLNIALSGLCLAIWLLLAVVFLLMNTILGYVLSAVLLVFLVCRLLLLSYIVASQLGTTPLRREKTKKRTVPKTDARLSTL